MGLALLLVAATLSAAGTELKTKPSSEPPCTPDLTLVSKANGAFQLDGDAVEPELLHAALARAKRKHPITCLWLKDEGDGLSVAHVLSLGKESHRMGFVAYYELKGAFHTIQADK